jgi:AAA15 family ATPase/GTPase
MLTSIKLKDYTTFVSSTIFDFNATNYKILEETNVGANRILKGALFVGENASGKTQVLDSIVLLLNLLLENALQNFALKKSMYTKGTKYSLSYEFNVDNNIIRYDVEFEKNSINKEQLYLNNELKINRIKNSGETCFGSEKINDDISSELSLVKLEYYNTRFNNDTILNKWFDYLKNSIYINCFKTTIKSYNPTKESEQLLVDYAKNNDIKDLNKFINKIGYNSEIVFKKQVSNIDETMILNTDKEYVCIRKKGTDIALPLPLESTGNQAFMNIILPIRFATQNDCMIIIDEFSSGLHNELEEALIRYFFNNSNNSQIFFTSHSTNLLDTSIIRPDQVYSFKFTPEQGTVIKRVSDENPRESQNMEKMYLNGVFDGMPKYNKEFKD